MPYELKLDKYSGPLEKLLELIEERKLEITDISLAAVTEDFLRYLERLAKEAKEDGTAEMRVLADFIAVASRLIFLKSKSLLPEASLTGEEEREIKELEERLKRYRAFKPAMKHLALRWKESSRAFSRPYLLTAQAPVFYPPPALAAGALCAALGTIFENLEKFVRESQVIRERVISLEEKISEVVERLRVLSSTTFSDLSGKKSRTEIVITFLAILHLVRERLLVVEQEHHLSDIIIKKPDGN